MVGGRLLTGDPVGAAPQGSGVDLALYVGDHLHEEHGVVPGVTARQLVGRALEHAGIYDYAVTVRRARDFDPGRFDPPRPCEAVLPAFENWLASTDRRGDHDSHYLLYHGGGTDGGCARGRVGVGRGDGLAGLDARDPGRFFPIARDGGAWLTLQEVGHTLGLCAGSDHDCGARYRDADRVRGASRLPDPTGVYVTPMDADTGGTNQCGQPTAGDPGWARSEWVDARYWDDCAGRQLRERFDRRHLLTVEAPDGDPAYRFTVSGSVLGRSDGCGAPGAGGTDAVDDGAVEGRVEGSRRSYAFTGEITDFSADPGVGVWIDCDPVVPDSVGNDTLTIEGTGDGPGSYRFAVAGGLRRAGREREPGKEDDRDGPDDSGDEREPAEDPIDGRTATGRVDDGTVGYRYWGGVRAEGFAVEGADYRFRSG